jgi:hypothetical protein
MGTMRTSSANWNDGKIERTKLYENLPLITKTLVDNEKFDGVTNVDIYGREEVIPQSELDRREGEIKKKIQHER